MDILLLVHRLPFPPNKGDKVRSYHLLRFLAARHQVHLATFVDDPEDLLHLDTVKQWCASTCIVSISPWRRKIAGLKGLALGRSLGIDYYQNGDIQNWVQSVLQREKPGAVVVFSSVMAQFVAKELGDQSVPVYVDMVDVDSQKWAQYAQQRSGPLGWMFALESRRLLAHERQIALQSAKTYLVTNQEAALFQRLVPECQSKVETMDNGVDADYFSPLEDRVSPYPVPDVGSPLRTVVFTGAMDYWPNVDAACWFVKNVMPVLRRRVPGVCFYVIGRKPGKEVLDLANEDVIVTGGVPDIRPYLQFAEVAVAPLRIARGIQNKILEAMAMARPVVASASCVQVIHGATEDNLKAAESPESFATKITQLLNAPDVAQAVGDAGRQLVQSHYSWTAHLDKLGTELALLEPCA